MAFQKPVLDSSKPQEGDLVIYNLGPGGLPALTGIGEVAMVHGTTFVVVSPSSNGIEANRRILNFGEARVVLSKNERAW